MEVVGDNLSELHQELQKLVLFAGPEATLTPQQVSQLASHSRSYNIFALTDALGEPALPRRPCRWLKPITYPVRSLLIIEERGVRPVRKSK